MTTITDLNNIVPNMDYSLKAIVFKIDREGDPSTKRPLNLVLQFESTGIKFKACTWDYSMTGIYKDMVKTRHIGKFTVRGSIYRDSMNIKIIEFEDTEKVSKLPEEKEFDNDTEESNLKSSISEKIDYVKNPSYKLILKQLIEDNETFFKWKAARSVHHAFPGGLALHSLSVYENAINLANKYSVAPHNMQIDWDLLITGTLLHDIGKLREYNSEGDFTFSGQMVSHLVSGVEMIDDVCRSNNIDSYSQDIMKLKHIIVSHHGKYEFGSPNLPILPEAYFVSFADAEDAATESMLEAMRVLNSGDISLPVRGLDDRKIMKL